VKGEAPPHELRRWLRSSATPYLSILIIGFVASIFAQYLWHRVWPGIPLVYGQSPEIYGKGATVAVAAIAWFVYRGRPTRQPILVSFLLVLAATWLVIAGLAKWHGDGFTYDTLLYTPVVLALLIKTPTAREVVGGLILLGWIIVTLFVISRTAEVTGVMAMDSVGDQLLAFERSNYWLPFSGTLGPDGRWPGPFGHNAMTGNAAAMLVVLAVGLKTRSRWVFGVVGTLALLLTASRGSQIGAVAGTFAILILGDNPLVRKVGRRILALIMGAIAVAGLTLVLVKNPSMTGRTEYWSAAIDVWISSPLTGVGTTGIQDSQASIVGANAHNLMIDALLKYGALGAAAVSAILVMSIALALKSSAVSSGLAAGIVTAYIVIGMAEANQGWLTITLPWIWLVLSTLLAGRTIEIHTAIDGSVCDTDSDSTSTSAST
jgi:hypothetical protein